MRGVPYEIFAANTNPTQTVERLWEAVDLVVKAWTTHDGPFNFEGRFTHRRAINIWPRPYQTPHPPIWITGSSDFEAIRKVAGRGYVFATFLQPYDKVREMFDAYRSAYRRLRAAGRRRHGFHAAGLYRGFRRGGGSRCARNSRGIISAKVEPQFRNPPGYVPIAINVKALQGAFSGPNGGDPRADARVSEGAGRRHVRHAGFRRAQIKRFYELVGGFDHLLMMQQAGFLDHQRTVRSMTLFANEVFRRSSICRVRGSAWRRRLSSERVGINTNTAKYLSEKTRIITYTWQVNSGHVVQIR